MKETEEMTGGLNELVRRLRRRGRAIVTIILLCGAVIVTVAAVLQLWAVSLGVLAAMHVVSVYYATRRGSAVPASPASGTRVVDPRKALRDLQEQIQNLDARTTGSIERLRDELLSEAEQLAVDEKIAGPTTTA